MHEPDTTLGNRKVGTRSPPQGAPYLLRGGRRPDVADFPHPADRCGTMLHSASRGRPNARRAFPLRTPWPRQSASRTRGPFDHHPPKPTQCRLPECTLVRPPLSSRVAPPTTPPYSHEEARPRHTRSRSCLDADPSRTPHIHQHEGRHVPHSTLTPTTSALVLPWPGSQGSAGINDTGLKIAPPIHSKPSKPNAQGPKPARRPQCNGTLLDPGEPIQFPWHPPPHGDRRYRRGAFQTAPNISEPPRSARSAETVGYDQCLFETGFYDIPPRFASCPGPVTTIDGGGDILGIHGGRVHELSPSHGVHRS